MDTETSFGPVLSLGVLNVVLKVIVIFCVSLTGQLIIHSMILVSGLTLKASGRTAVMFDSDGSIFKIRHTLSRVKSMSGFGTLACILALSLFPAEMATEFGVIKSNRCKPEHMRTWGICAAEIVSWDAWSSRLSLAMLVENLRWDKRELISHPIREGFRKTCDGTEYFGNQVERNKSLPIVIHRCWAKNMRIVGGNGSILTFANNITETKGEGIGFVSVATPNRSKLFKGMGGIFDNYQFTSSFLTVQHPDNDDGSCSATVLEYPNSKHLMDIRRHAANKSTFEVKSRGVVLGYDVGCRLASLNAKKFHEAIFTYRFAQLSRSSKRNAIPKVNVTIGEGDNQLGRHSYKKNAAVPNETRPVLNAPCPLDAGDVVKAVIAMKITENISCEGETYRYTTCGTFKAVMAYPLVTVMVLVLVMWSILLYLVRRMGDRVEAPVTANQWMCFAIQSCNAEKKYVTLGSDEFKNEYKRYGREDFLGEFLVKKGYVGFYFVLRRVIFMKPDEEMEIDYGVATLRNVLSFAGTEARIDGSEEENISNMV